MITGDKRQIAKLRETVLYWRSMAATAERERDEARRLVVAVADRLVTVVDCLSRAAERKDRRNA